MLASNNMFEKDSRSGGNVVRMKRKIIIIVVTICILAVFGALLHSPPSLIDAVSGATPKSRQENIDIANLIEPSEYILIINTSALPLNDVATRIAIRQTVFDEVITEDSSIESVSLQLAITKDNAFLSQRAEMIMTQLETVGFDVVIHEYSETMFISRAFSGKYDLLLIADSQPVLPNLPDAESTVIPNGEEDK